MRKRNVKRMSFPDLRLDSVDFANRGEQKNRIANLGKFHTIYELTLLSWLAGEPLLLTVWHLKLSNDSPKASRSLTMSLSLWDRLSVLGKVGDERGCWSAVQDRPRKFDGRIRKASRAMLADTWGRQRIKNGGGRVVRRDFILVIKQMILSQVTAEREKIERNKEKPRRNSFIFLLHYSRYLLEPN